MMRRGINQEHVELAGLGPPSQILLLLAIFAPTNLDAV
jgi:hypothetical protein